MFGGFRIGGGIGKRTLPAINVFDRGVSSGLSSAASNRAILQDLLNTTTRQLLIPEDVYYDGVLFIRDYNHITVSSGASMILDQSISRPDYNDYPMYANIFMGAWNQPNLDLLTVSTTPLIGDVVWLRSTETFTVGGVSIIPTESQLNIVKTISPLTFVYPLQIDYDEMMLLTNNGNNIVGTTEPQYMARNAVIEGGNWINNESYGPFCTTAGIGSTINVDSITAENGVGYGNLNAYCDFTCGDMQLNKQIVELAMSSHNNTVNITSAYNSGVSTIESQGAIWINEASRNNTVNIGIADSDGTHVAGVLINAATNNTVNIDTLTITDSIYDTLVDTPAYPGTVPESVGNEINITTITHI